MVLAGAGTSGRRPRRRSAPGGGPAAARTGRPESSGLRGAKCTAAAGSVSLRDIVNEARSDVPAVTHVDYSARVQTVERATSPRFHDILKAFEERTGCRLLINTSFNVRGEPIVCTPENAYRCFMRTEMDCLVIESFLLEKKAQPAWSEKGDWRQDYVLD